MLRGLSAGFRRATVYCAADVRAVPAARDGFDTGLAALAVRFVAGFFFADFLAVDFFAVGFFAVGFLAVDLLAVVLPATFFFAALRTVFFVTFFAAFPAVFFAAFRAACFGADFRVESTEGRRVGKEGDRTCRSRGA